MDIYAPLAERIGMQEMKTELEDLAFAELNPEARKSILKRLEFLRERGGDLVTRIITELTKLLADHGVKAAISGREKTPYSIWHKMQRKYHVRRCERCHHFTVDFPKLHHGWSMLPIPSIWLAVVVAVVASLALLMVVG